MNTHLGRPQPAGDGSVREVRRPPAPEPTERTLCPQGRGAQPFDPRLVIGADQVGACTHALKLLHDLIAAHVMAGERLHGDDTVVPVLAKGKTAKGRAWVYGRDDAPFGGPDAPAALFHCSRDRGQEHPVKHLDGWTGLLQADAYAGYNRLYDPGRAPAPVVPALCWAHSRRKFFELADIKANTRRGGRAPPISPLALEAVRRIDALFDIEREINGQPPD